MKDIPDKASRLGIGTRFAFSLALGSFFCADAFAQVNVAGVWGCDDGAVYYVSQNGTTVWWVGLSNESGSWGAGDFHKGLAFTNVFKGQIGSDNVINGQWADVPRGAYLGTGTLSLTATGSEMRKRSEMGGFGGGYWQRISRPPDRRDVRNVFVDVRRNDGNTMAGHMTGGTPFPNFGVYKDHVVLRGSVETLPRSNFPGDESFIPREYPYFMCADHGTDFPAGTKWFHGDWFSDPPDGDLTLNVRGTLNGPNFWTAAWFQNPAEIQRRLQQYNNLVHAEFLMFAKSAGFSDCSRHTAFLPHLPAWAERGANSVLFNGRPLNADLRILDNPAMRRDESQTAAVLRMWGSSVGSAGSYDLRVGSQVRISGVLALDEHPGTAVEIHPVYSIDVFQNFGVDRDPNVNLTGVWDSPADTGLYYVRQIGNTVWWLGMSQDQGRAFTNVFRGTFDGGRLVGEWSDVPLGGYSNSGWVEIVTFGDQGATSFYCPDSWVFAGYTWNKIYDASLAQLSVDRSGNGRVQSEPAGISCGGSCDAIFPAGRSIRLTATPDPTWNFAAWSGPCSGTGDCNITANYNKRVAATFTYCGPWSCDGLCGWQPDSCGRLQWCGYCCEPLPCSGCGMQPDGCGGYQWCGECGCGCECCLGSLCIIC